MNGAVLPRQLAVPMTVNVNAPLVVYGDTSQDGVWYNGVATQQSLGKFASKPQPHMDNVQFTLSTPSVGATNPSVTGDMVVSAAYTGFNTVSNTDDTSATSSGRDGGSWVTAGFKVNGLVTIGGVAVGTVYGFKSDTADTRCGRHPDHQQSVAGLRCRREARGPRQGVEHRVDQAHLRPVRSGLRPRRSDHDRQDLHVAGLCPLPAAATPLRAATGGSWITEKFAKGQSISISGTTYNDGGGGPNYVITDVTRRRSRWRRSSS